MHQQVLDWVGQYGTAAAVSVLDIGGRDLNGSPRMFFPNALPYHVLDIHPGPNVHIVGDATDWEGSVSAWLTGGTYDLVVCTEVFEHVKDWPGILRTAYAALRPGGRLIFTCAGPGRPVHSGVEAVWGLVEGEDHYANVSPEEIVTELSRQGWTQMQARLLGTDTQGTAVRPREVTMSATLSRSAS